MKNKIKDLNNIKMFYQVKNQTSDKVRSIVWHQVFGRNRAEIWVEIRSLIKDEIYDQIPRK